MEKNEITIKAEEEFDPDAVAEFEPCANCDLPDACADFGCAIKQGLRTPDEV